MKLFKTVIVNVTTTRFLSLKYKAVLPLSRRDCYSIKKKVDYTKFMVRRHHIVVALVGEAPLRTAGSTSRRL
jgi:hypothetical protein